MFARAAALEANELKVRRLRRMTHRELRALLAGDPAVAAEWVRAAAESGLPAAEVRLGRMLLEGRGLERDEAAALEWFLRAARSGDAEALNMVGRCLENGWGAAADLERAALFYRAAAASGDAWGEYNYGNLLFEGRGVEPDRPQALHWYLRAARQGHGRAMNLIGRCLEEGWGCPRNPRDAAWWYRRSAESGYFRGQLNHALALAERGETESAAEWFWKAAIGGDAAVRLKILAVLETAADLALKQVRDRLRRLAASDVSDAADGRPPG